MPKAINHWPQNKDARRSGDTLCKSNVSLRDTKQQCSRRSERCLVKSIFNIEDY